MNLINSGANYGIISRVLHWSMAVLMIGMITVGFYMSGLENSPEKWELYSQHKQWGVIAGMLILFRLIWLANNPKVEPFADSKFKMFAAKATKKILYFFMLAYPISGVIMSMAGGHGIDFFGFPLPQFIEENKDISSAMHSLHIAMGWFFVAVIVLHIAGALHHKFVAKDNLINRMIGKND